MGDVIIKTGDLLIIQIFPPAVVPLLAAPVELVGTATLKIDGVPACLPKDVLPAPMELREPIPYTAAPYSIPGSGTLIVELTPANISERTMNGGPLLLKGPIFPVSFIVTQPAQQPTPAGPVPDPVAEKSGTGRFVSTNLTIRAG